MNDHQADPRLDNILLVDDNPINLDVLVGMLKRKGYHVRPVPNGRLALLAAEIDPPDIILLDINMPGMDGFEVCRQLKQNEKLQAIPVIFISALSETLDKVKAFQVGGVDYITKPFQLEEVEARITTQLKLRRFQEQKQEEYRIHDRLDFLQMFIEAIPIPVFYKNAEGVYQGCNSAYENLFERRRDEIIGNTVFEIMSQEIATLFRQKDLELLESDGMQYFETQLISHGIPCDLIINKALVKGKRNEAQGIVGTVLDITERKRMEDQMRQKLVELESVNRISFALHNGKTLQEQMELLITETLAQFNCPTGVIIIYDQEFHTCQATVSKGWMAEMNIAALTSDPGQKLIHPRAPYFIDDFCSDANIQEALPPYDYPAGWGGVALSVENSQGPIGFLAIAYEHPRVLTESEVEILKIIAEIAGNVISNTLLTEQLHLSNEVLRGEVNLRRNIQDQLAKEKELLSVTLMCIDDGVVCTNRDGNISLYNRAAEKITGYDEKEVGGYCLESAIHLVDPHTGAPLSRVIQELQKRDEIGNQQAHYEPPVLITKSGEKKICAGSISQVIGEDERVYGYVIVFRDITERYRSESQLALTQKMEGIGQLAAGIAHEINTPIQYVGDNLQFLERAFVRYQELLEKYEQHLQTAINPSFHSKEAEELIAFKKQKKIDHYQKEIPNAIQESLEGVERVRKIVLAIREFSHPSEKEMKLSDINHGIETTITISRNEWKYHAEMETDLDPGVPLIYCQIDEINQVILNMIINSSHAIQEAIAKDPNHKGLIRISTREQKGDVIITIQDTGCGIPPVIQNRIFEPFFTTKDVGKGTGQGLSLAHIVIVQKHKGKIEVESQPGKGTTFTIKLPVVEETKKEA